MLRIQFASQMWAARPHLANIFEKLLDQKTFICLWLVIGNPIHETNNEHKFSNLSWKALFFYPKSDYNNGYCPTSDKKEAIFMNIHLSKQLLHWNSLYQQLN